MADVIDLTKHIPHGSGDARCLHCGHEFNAVVPTGLASFECPECHLWKAVPVGLFVPKTGLVTCDCNNQLFFIAEDGIFCVLCGKDNE